MRRATIDDLDWMIDLAVKRFPKIVQDRDATESWLANALVNPSFCVLLDDHGFAIGVGGTTIFNKHYTVANIHTLVTEKGNHIWEAIRMARHIKLWAEQHGAEELYLADSTDIDLGPIAKRIGATEITPRYVVKLNSCATFQA